MQLKVPLSPKATIDRALARAVAAQGLWAAAGGTGPGPTPSARAKARMVTLLWSDPAMLADWGYLATAAGGTKFLSLTALLVDVLPRLAELERFVGIDWTADPVRPELDPGELARRLRQALKAAFVRQAVESGSVWILQGAEGPSCLISKLQPGREFVPCWGERGDAELRIAGLLRDTVAAEVPLAAVRDRLLVWAAETGRLAAPGFCEGDGGIEVEAGELIGDLVEAPVRVGGACR
jgi:hypothetical protein